MYRVGKLKVRTYYNDIKKLQKKNDSTYVNDVAVIMPDCLMPNTSRFLLLLLDHYVNFNY